MEKLPQGLRLPRQRGEDKHMGEQLETGQSRGQMSLTCHLWSTVALHALLVLTGIPSVSYKGLFQWQVYSIATCFFQCFPPQKVLAVVCDGQVL